MKNSYGGREIVKGIEIVENKSNVLIIAYISFQHGTADKYIFFSDLLKKKKRILA